MYLCIAFQTNQNAIQMLNDWKQKTWVIKKTKMGFEIVCTTIAIKWIGKMIEDKE